MFEGKVIYDKSYGHVAYGCAACCAAKSVYLFYDPFYNPIGPGFTNGVYENDDCGDIGEDDSGDFYNWNTANHAIDTTTIYGAHTGVAVGSTTSSTSGYVIHTNGRNGCYEVPSDPSGPTDVAATPTNFHVITVVPDTGGNLTWTYNWDSTTGPDTSDLSQCTVRELVNYPGTGGFNWPSPPYDTSGNPTNNPTIGTSPAVNGAIIDHQLHPGFLKPYKANSFTATQVFQFSCTNYQNGAWINLSPSYNIVRSVSQSGSAWIYTVTKDGHNATAQLP